MVHGTVSKVFMMLGARQGRAYTLLLPVGYENKQHQSKTMVGKIMRREDNGITIVYAMS